MEEQEGLENPKVEKVDQTDRESIDAELRSRGSDDSIRPPFIKGTEIHGHIEVNLDKVRKPLESLGSRELGPREENDVEASNRQPK